MLRSSFHRDFDPCDSMHFSSQQRAEEDRPRLPCLFVVLEAKSIDTVLVAVLTVQAKVHAQ